MSCSARWRPAWLWAAAVLVVDGCGTAVEFLLELGQAAARLRRLSGAAVQRDAVTPRFIVHVGAFRMPRPSLDAASRGHAAELIVDLDGLTFLDSCGIRTLVAGHQLAAEYGTACSVIDPGRHV